MVVNLADRRPEERAAIRELANTSAVAALIGVGERTLKILGDWFQMLGAWRDALTIYREVWLDLAAPDGIQQGVSLGD